MRGVAAEIVGAAGQVRELRKIDASLAASAKSEAVKPRRGTSVTGEPKHTLRATFQGEKPMKPGLVPH